jgi:transcriptional regulator with PAS, ATPase and Fis domain
VADARGTCPCLDLFPHDGRDAILQLIATLRERRAIVIAQWQALAPARLSSRGTPSAARLREIYVPYLRRAESHLLRGDGTAFVAFAHALGACVADDGMPFAGLVAHVSLLHESCVNALADRAVELRDALLVLDRVIACAVGAAAEGYHDRRSADPRAALATVTTVDAESAPHRFHDMVGRSSAMQRVFERVRRLASTDAAVLIVGETGTGKELVARAIHEAGARRAAPFVALNCAALPRELIEAELFGYRRGAFSGAVVDGPGLFRAAAGGTLLLDEITEMGPELQAKLLRVLQERTVRPLGAVAEQPVDVRIIASTNRDPEGALASGHLRADLYYRLSVSTVLLPPLRDRREDVEPLVDHRLRVLAEREPADRHRAMTPAAVAALAALPWPGNVRQLFNVVDDALTMAASAVVDVGDLALPGNEPAPPMHAWVPVALPTFEQNERLLVQQTLAYTGGNKLRAARRLGISRKKLYAMIARYRLSS